MSVTTPETAIGYIRVSTEDQVNEGVSLEAQRERIEGYCKAQGLTLTGIVEDPGISGATPLESRHEGSQLVSPSAQHIVAIRLDRLFRDALDALGHTREWDRSGIALHLIDVGGATINTSSAMGRMFLTMMAGFAELERNLIAERTSAALQHKKRQKEVYSRLPLGYDDEDGHLVPVDEEQELLSEIIDQHAQGLSLHQIAGDLNNRGVPGKRGGKFYASTIRAIIQNSLHEELRTAA